MKIFFAATAVLLFSFSIKAQPFETFHDFTHLTILHDTLHLSNYAGKKVLVVNTASFCGFTYELGDLRILDSLYGGPNFAIIGFPCNDFGGQEPFDDSVLYQFYRGNYSVGFQIMSKIAITSPDTAEVYKWLQLQSRNGVANANVTWNFNKFAIDEAGHWIRHYSQTVNPLDTSIVNWILSPNTTGITSKSQSAEAMLLNNPSNGSIELSIKTNRNEFLTASLYDIQGAMVTELFSGTINENRVLNFSPPVNAGIYFLKLQGTTLNKTLKVCFTR